MHRVKVSQRVAGGPSVIRGELEFHGLKVRLPDGSLLLERDERGRPVAEEVILRPPGVVPPGVAVRIGQAIATGQRGGHTDGFDWSLLT